MEVKELWEDVEFCRGSCKDFHVVTLIRFLSGKGLHGKLPQCMLDDDARWKEESKKYDLNTEEGAAAAIEAFEIYLKNSPDTTNVLYEYTLDDNFKIEDLMTREMAIEFWEHYNIDLEYWGK
jgi:hypothetical protein